METESDNTGFHETRMYALLLICSCYHRGTKRLVSVNICSVEGNSADIFVSKVSPGIFVIKVK